jgi:hypothetical protein
MPAWRDALWGHDHWHLDELDEQPPTAGAYLWWLFGRRYPKQLRKFLLTYWDL